MRNYPNGLEPLPIPEGNSAIKALRLMQYDPMQYDLVNERLKHSVKESFLSPIKEEMEGGKKKKRNSGFWLLEI